MRHASLFLFLFLLTQATASAQTPAPSNTNREEILAYKLTLPKAHSLISATRDMTKYAMGLPDFQQRAVKMMTMTSAQQQAELEADPNAVKIFKDHGLTTKEYMVGGPALRMAMLMAEGSTNPNLYASPANLAFAKQNMSVLKPRADSVEAMMKRPPGK